MRSILVLADRSPVSEPRLQAALSLARASGHLTVLIDTPMARYLATDAWAAAIWRPTSCARRSMPTMPLPRPAPALAA
jgi:hypothetical protein